MFRLEMGAFLGRRQARRIQTMLIDFLLIYKLHALCLYMAETTQGPEVSYDEPLAALAFLALLRTTVVSPTVPTTEWAYIPVLLIRSVHVCSRIGGAEPIREGTTTHGLMTTKLTDV